jgi:hypothetical protein
VIKFLLKFLPLIIHEVAEIIKEKYRQKKVQTNFDNSLKNKENENI